MSVEFQEELFAATKLDQEAKKEGNEGTTFAADFLKQCKQDFCNNEGPDITTTLPRIVKTGYKELNMINYFTAGHDEVGCWVGE
jgi:ribosome-binding ATPase YchF (GTP1/OBG family)